MKSPLRLTPFIKPPGSWLHPFVASATAFRFSSPRSGWQNQDLGTWGLLGPGCLGTRKERKILLVQIEKFTLLRQISAGVGSCSRWQCWCSCLKDIDTKAVLTIYQNVIGPKTKKRGFEGGRNERKDIQENGDNCNKMQCFYYSDLRAQTNAERQW